MKKSINQQTTAQPQTGNGRYMVSPMKAKSVLSLLTLISLAAPSLVRADCVPTAPVGYTVPFTMVAQRTYASSGERGNTGYGTGSMTYTEHLWTFDGTTLASSGNELLFSQDKMPNNGCFLCTLQPFYLYDSEALALSVSDGHSFLATTSAVNVALSSPTLGNLSGVATCDATSGELFFSTSVGVNVISFGAPVPPVVLQ